MIAIQNEYDRINKLKHGKMRPAQVAAYPKESEQEKLMKFGLRPDNLKAEEVKTAIDTLNQLLKFQEKPSVTR